MDILSFILGMSIVVVIAVAVVAVIAFVKVNKTNKEIETIHTIMGNEFERSNRNREEDIKNDQNNAIEFIRKQIDLNLDVKPFFVK